MHKNSPLRLARRDMTHSLCKQSNFSSPSLNFPKTAYASPFITIDLRVPEAEGSFLTIRFVAELDYAKPAIACGFEKE
jgi:hypothetical protein